MKRKAVKDYIRLTILALFPFVQNVIASLAKNKKTFPQLSPTCEELEQKLKECEDLHVKYLESVDVSNMILHQRDSHINELRAMLGNWVDYVNTVAQNDVEVLNKTGFNLSKAVRKLHNVLPKIVDLVVLPDNREGTVNCSWHKVKYALYYEIFIVDDRSGEVSYTLVGTSTKSVFTVGKLKSGDKVDLAVRSVNSNCFAPYSTTVSCIVP